MASPFQTLTLGPARSKAEVAANAKAYLSAVAAAAAGSNNDSPNPSPLLPNVIPPASGEGVSIMKPKKTPMKKQITRIDKYLKSWEKDKKFDWLYPHPTNETKALCRVCPRVVLRAQRHALIRHYVSEGHINGLAKSIGATQEGRYNLLHNLRRFYGSSLKERAAHFSKPNAKRGTGKFKYPQQNELPTLPIGNLVPVPGPPAAAQAPAPGPSAAVLAPAPRPSAAVLAPAPRPSAAVLAPAPRPSAAVLAPAPAPAPRPSSVIFQYPLRQPLQYYNLKLPIPRSPNVMPRSPRVQVITNHTTGTFFAPPKNPLIITGLKPKDIFTTMDWKTMTWKTLTVLSIGPKIFPKPNVPEFSGPAGPNPSTLPPTILSIGPKIFPKPNVPELSGPAGPNPSTLPPTILSIGPKIFPKPNVPEFSGPAGPNPPTILSIGPKIFPKPNVPEFSGPAGPNPSTLQPTRVLNDNDDEETDSEFELEDEESDSEFAMEQVEEELQLEAQVEPLDLSTNKPIDLSMPSSR